jgi:hypothetical protein
MATLLTPAAIDSTLIQDGQADGSITAADFRVICDSLAGVVSVAQTANYTAALTDRGTCVEMNVAGANTFTVPPNASVAFDIGVVIEVRQVGTGQTTITAGAGVTLRTATSATTRVQWSTVSVQQRAANEWVLSGDLT